VVIEHLDNLNLSWWTSLSLLRRGKDERFSPCKKQG